MSPRQWLVSLLIVALCGLKLAEAAFRIDSWPLSNIPMFSQYVPVGVTPRRIVLRARTTGDRFEVTPGDFGLTVDELNRRFDGPLTRAITACGDLGNIYNTAHPRDRLTALEGRAVAIPRPGRANPGDVPFPCFLAAQR
jgi:hypothetical protein